MKNLGYINVFNIIFKNSDKFNDLFFYFMFYSFGGWIVENLYSFFTIGKFKKEGFLLGPFKPMYGFAPVILLILLSGIENKILIFLLCFIIPSSVEYISGFLLQKLFNKHWWDYSRIPFQLNGHVCLRFSIYWIFLSLAVIYLLHPLIFKLYNNIEGIWSYISPIIMIVFIADITFTILYWRSKGVLFNQR